MHSFPLWADILFSVLAILFSWQAWAILGAVGVLGFLWYRKNKKTKSLDN